MNKSPCIQMLILMALYVGGMMPEFGVWKVEREAWRVALNEYLVKN